MAELIIVVNQQESSWIKSLVSEFKLSSLAVSIIENSCNHLGYARRLLVDHCKSTYLCIIDPDCIVSKNWLKDYTCHLNLFLDEKVASLGGQVLQAQALSYLRVGPSNLISLGSPQLKLANKIETIDHNQTSNVLYCVRAVRSVGNFSLAHHQSGEDLELGLRLTYFGYKNYLLPRARVTHASVLNTKQLCHRFLKLGLGQKNPYLFNRKLHRQFVLLSLTLMILFFLSSGLFYLMLFLGLFFYKHIMSYFFYLIGFILSLVRSY